MNYQSFSWSVDHSIGNNSSLSKSSSKGQAREDKPKENRNILASLNHDSKWDILLEILVKEWWIRSGTPKKFNKLLFHVNSYLIDKVFSTLMLYEKKNLSNFFGARGQLISKCPLGVKTSSKKPTKFFPGFLPYPLKRGQIKKVV